MEIEWDSACSEYIVNGALAEVAYDNLVELGPVKYTPEELETAAKYQTHLDQAARNVIRAGVAKALKGESAGCIDEIAQKPLIDDIYPLVVSDSVMPGSTDVGDASWQAPTGQFTVGMYPPGTPPHSWQWVALGKGSIAHKGMLQAGKALAMSALDVIESPELLEKAKAEFLGRLGGETYKCAIPEDVVPK